MYANGIFLANERQSVYINDADSLGQPPFSLRYPAIEPPALAAERWEWLRSIACPEPDKTPLQTHIGDGRDLS